MAEKFSATMTAAALVVFAAALYLGFDTKVSWPGPAWSIPATAVISVSGEALSRRALRALAMSASFIEESGRIVAEGVHGGAAGGGGAAGREGGAAGGRAALGWTGEGARLSTS